MVRLAEHGVWVRVVLLFPLHFLKYMGTSTGPVFSLIAFAWTGVGRSWTDGTG